MEKARVLRAFLLCGPDDYPQNAQYRIMKL